MLKLLTAAAFAVVMCGPVMAQDMKTDGFVPPKAFVTSNGVLKENFLLSTMSPRMYDPEPLVEPVQRFSKEWSYWRGLNTRVVAKDSN